MRWSVKWENTKAKDVCDVCFDGDVLAMQRHAVAYVSGGHSAVPHLGAAFRALLPGRSRGKFWKKALRQIDFHLASGLPVANGGVMPEWTKSAGGCERWQEWAKRQAERCRDKAKKWAQKRKLNVRQPSVKEWRDAIISAIRQSGGRGHFSQLPLTFVDRKETDPHWPSVDHLVGIADPKVVIELRLFNDMKSICSEEEFREAVGHLAAVLPASAKRLPDDWRAVRCFG